MKKLLFIIFLLPIISFAQVEYQLLEPLPCIQNTGQGVTEAQCADGVMIKEINTNTYLAYLFNFSLAFAAVAAVIVITIAGFEYATSDIISTKSAARTRISNAIWGLLTILCSYFILETIDPRLVNIDTRLEPIDIKGQVFNYDDLVNTLIDEKVKEDLRNANQRMKTLTTEAQALRTRALQIPENNPERLRLESEALKLEREAAMVGHMATLEANYDYLNEAVNNVNSGQITAIEQLEIDQRRQVLLNVNQRNIEKLERAGDIESAQVLRTTQEYFSIKTDQDLFIRRSIGAVSEYTTSSDSYNPNSPVLTAILNDLKNYKIPEGNHLSTEQIADLAAEKDKAIVEIQSMINSQQKE